MPRKLTIAFFVHTIRSDWNNGNAHFLRGLARALGSSAPASAALPVGGHGHSVTVFEREGNWSIANLLTEARGAEALDQFSRIYSDLNVKSYLLDRLTLRDSLADHDIVVVHEWNPPELIEAILSLREELGYRALFHDTHHRASSSPDQLATLQVERFDGVIAFGEALRTIYRRDLGIDRVWTLHEAADTTVFYPREASLKNDVLWIGNWGDDERSQEIREFLVYPASELHERRFCIHGVRYPQEALGLLAEATIEYAGYLPNLDAPAHYASARLALHIPRQQYARAMTGIPTIRVFEALASGLPLLSAPWEDTERLFQVEDFLLVRSSREMVEAIDFLLSNPAAAQDQAARGLRTVLDRHTCAHRAQEFTTICEEVLA